MPDPKAHVRLRPDGDHPGPRPRGRPDGEQLLVVSYTPGVRLRLADVLADGPAREEVTLTDPDKAAELWRMVRDLIELAKYLRKEPNRAK